MKSRIGMTLLTLLLIIGAVAVGCTPADAPETEGPDDTTPTPGHEDEETVPASPETEVIKWQFQGHPVVADYAYQAVLRVADHITTMSGGRLEVAPFSGGSIVPATEELEGVNKGILNMGSSCPMYNVNKFPQAALFDMVSGGMTALQMTLWHTRGDGDALAAKLWEDKMNVKYVGTQGFLPPEVWAHSTEKIETPKDLDGLKMRCSGDGGEILAAMGVATVFFPAGEIYESLQRGVVDACEAASPMMNWGLGLQEVAKYVYLSPSRAPTDCLHVWVNRDDWEALSPDLQAIVIDACEAVGIDYTADAYIRDDEMLVNFIDYPGTEVLPLPAAVEEAYLKAAQVFYAEKGASDPFYQEILDSHWAFKALCDRAGIK